MNLARDQRVIEELAPSQDGVFSTADLRSALAERHPAALGRRVRSLVSHGVLFRFSRGFYVANDFELPVLSQRIAPESCVSFEVALARKLVIGTRPTHHVAATKVGRTRRYSSRGYVVEHVGISRHLLFGDERDGGVRYADAEKAVLDVLYFHLRGRRFAFDVHSDLDLAVLSMERLNTYLREYRNPKFVAYAKRVLGLT